MKKNYILYVLFAGLLSSCTPDETPNQELKLELPARPFIYTTGSHIPTLGRVLFYDRQLSLNNSVSCGTCHKQRLAFSDDRQFSIGFEDKITRRNSMPIQNIGSNFNPPDSILKDPVNLFVPTFLFWDGREQDLRTMVKKPITNHIEMGFSDLSDLQAKLSNVPYYESLFTQAFGDKTITEERIAAAITAFVQSISSRQTKLDKSFGNPSELSALEQKGRVLFSSVYDCNSCHQIENPHGYIQAGVFANIGLDKVYDDRGLAEVTKAESDNGKFKIPSLRNVALTAPYMHDGRFQTLDQVLNHYSDGIADNENLDFRLRTPNGQPRNMEIPKADKEAIIAFLHTLTDYEMATDEKFSDPFKAQ